MEKHDVLPGRIITIENFLTLEECQHYIQLSENIGYESATVTTKIGPVTLPGVRNNSRAMLDDFELADQMWQRIQSFVPTPLFSRDAIGLNERWRFYQYEPGERFKMHQDGSVKRLNGEKSLVTFMIYLNEGAEGGETRFELNAPQKNITVVPKAGMALLFLHVLRHEGAPVLSGRKYVMRSDVMYSGPTEFTSWD